MSWSIDKFSGSSLVYVEKGDFVRSLLSLDWVSAPSLWTVAEQKKKKKLAIQGSILAYNSWLTVVDNGDIVTDKHKAKFS